MSDEMFGGIDLDELSAPIPRGTYKLQLKDISDRAANTQYGEPERRFKIFNFSIVEAPEGNEDAEQFEGESTKGLFLNYWPNLRSDIGTMDSSQKSQVRKSATLYKKLAQAFGASPEEIKSGSVDWDSYVGSYIYATVFPNNQDGQPQIDQNSFQHESSVEI